MISYKCIFIYFYYGRPYFENKLRKSMFVKFWGCFKAATAHVYILYSFTSELLNVLAEIWFYFASFITIMSYLTNLLDIPNELVFQQTTLFMSSFPANKTYFVINKVHRTVDLCKWRKAQLLTGCFKITLTNTHSSLVGFCYVEIELYTRVRYTVHILRMYFVPAFFYHAFWFTPSFQTYVRFILHAYLVLQLLIIHINLTETD